MAESIGLENRRRETVRGFESLPLRQSTPSLLAREAHRSEVQEGTENPLQKSRLGGETLASLGQASQDTEKSHRMAAKYSIDEQIRTCRSLAAQKGLEILDIFGEHNRKFWIKAGTS